MSVVVRGMRIPESCTKCIFSYKEESYEPKEGTYYSVSTCKGDVISTNYYTNENKKYTYSRPDYCPLVEIPEKHGRLIDADELAETAEYYETVMDIGHYAKTVIEAEDG